MAITIDWYTRVISIPKADLVLVQSVPVEVREMNLNWFRVQLKDIEDSEAGMANLDTHKHNTEVTLGGLTYARIIEIINGYTVTFEDGQYAVNLVGANSNVADVVNVNQVSVRSANSAGMVTSQDIVYSSYNGGVHVNINSINSGTIHPVGTPRMPVNNMPDALLIATYNGFNKFFIHGDIIVDSGGNYTNMTFIGESPTKSIINVSAISNVVGCEFYEAHVTGTLDGDILLSKCIITDLNYVYGYIEQCFLDAGTIVLAGGSQAIFLDCWTGEAIPEIDMGGSGQSLSLSGLNGRVKIRNKMGVETVNIFLNSGVVILDLTTVTRGMITAEGVGDLIDQDGDSIHSGTYGDLVVANNMTNPESISEHVWDSVAEGNFSAMDILKILAAVTAGRLSGANTTTINIRDLGNTKNRVVATVDEHGNRTAVTLDTE